MDAPDVTIIVTAALDDYFNHARVRQAERVTDPQEEGE